MEFDKSIFNLFNRDDFTYRKGDEAIGEEYSSCHNNWTLWCKSLAEKAEKFEIPDIKSWQNNGQLASDFWARLKYDAFADSVACISLLAKKEGLYIELDFEFNNKSSSLTKEEYNIQIINNVGKWANENNIDTDLFYIRAKTNKCTLREYFNSSEKTNWFANTKGININVGVFYNTDQFLELDTENEKLINVLINLSNLYEMIQNNKESIRYWLGGATYEEGDVSQKFIENNVYGMDWVLGEDIKYALEDEELLEQLFDNYNLSANGKKMMKLFFQLKAGDKIAIKSSYAKRKTSILRIKAIGTVKADLISGYKYDKELKHTIPVEWEQTEQVDIEGIGGHWETLSEVKYQDDINLIFYDNDLNKNGSGENTKKDGVLYSKEQFLEDAFIDESKYDTIVKRLESKKNIILQGAPGVGKSYIAKKIAYSILGVIDKNKVEMIQFHQSYSYEDFIMGYRPNKSGGFDITEGVLYKFCKRAIDNPEDKYFFIIDEINRGNLSKIFGELMLLIEADKRGESFGMSTVYSDEKFYLPENLYIIGLMNTADRSLALIDYALRRRFSFIDIEPAFGENFTKYTNQFKAIKLDKVLNIIKAINDDIENDESLGKGFKIGHSYFCNLKSASDEELLEIIDCEIVPLLEEYWIENNDKVKNYSKNLHEAVANE